MGGVHASGPLARGCVASLVVWISLPSLASAEPMLFVYGPDGTATERRVMAVLADADGHCVSSSAPLRWSADEGEVVSEDSAGDCVRWLRLHNRSGRDVLRLRVSGEGLDATASVPMRDATRLVVQARRVGRVLRVAVEGATSDGVSGTVVTADGRIPLEPRGNELSAPVPDGLLGVVVRSGAMVGVTAVRPRVRPDAPEVLVLAADLAIEGGGPPREVAFVVAADARGRLSQELPLTVQSERGELRSMRWISEGVAAIGLSAPTAVSSIDLSVGHEGESLTRVELDVAGDWPVSAEMHAEEVDTGFRVDGLAQGADGEPIGPERLRARCGRAPLRPLPALCDVAPGGEVLVGLVATVDGQPIPLASRRLTAGPAPTATPAPPVSMPEPAARPWSVAVYLRGGYDVWERGAVGVGARGSRDLLPWLRVGLSLGYGHTLWSSTDPLDQSRVLRGERLSVSALVFGELLFGDDIGAALRVELGGGWTRAQVTLDALDEQADVAHLAARVAGGPRFRLGDFTLGADIGLSTGVDSSSLAWDRAPFAAQMEAHGAVSLP